jgi:hypothetical protein
VHTNTKPQIPSTRGRSLGWRMHGSVEDTKLSTNKQHSLSLKIRAVGPVGPVSEWQQRDCDRLMKSPLSPFILVFGNKEGLRHGDY